MTKAEVVNEILKIITNSPSFDASDYDEWGEEIEWQVNHWVEKNNVINVEFTVSKEELEDVYNEWKPMKDLTSCKIHFLKTYDAVQDKMEKVLGKNFDGPGWDGSSRDDTRWNEMYFFTGSDCTHYVLVKKINEE